MKRGRIVARWLTAPVRVPWRWFSHQPRAIQVGLILVLLAALGIGGYYSRSYLHRRQHAKDVATAWSEYNAGIRKRDLAVIQSALDRVLEVSPGDPTATNFKAMISSGEADPELPGLAMALLQEHIKNDRLAEAAREAEKVLAWNPKYWQARCAVAHHALQVRKDIILTEKHLAQLPDPEDPEALADAGGLLYALKLSDAVGRDASKLRRVIVQRLLPFLRGGTAAAAPTAAKAQLIECYLEAFADSGSLNDLANYLGAVDRLMDGAVGEAMSANDVRLLSRLGRASQRLRGALGILRNQEPPVLPEDRFAPVAKSVDERTRRAWQKVREQEPDQVEAYIAMANLALLSNDPQAAWDQVIDGLKACGSRDELLEIQVLLAARFGTYENLENLRTRLHEAAEEARTDPDKWCIVANVEMMLNRNDRALLACEKALAIREKHHAACLIKTKILVHSGKPIELIEARELLHRLGETALRTNRELAALHARVLVGTGLWVLVQDEFDKVIEAHGRLNPKTFEAAFGFLSGVYSAPPDRERARWVADRTARIPAGDPAAQQARMLRFAALYRVAELSVTEDPRGGLPLWDSESVAAALRAYGDMRPEEHSDATMMALLASLQLRAQGNAANALRTVNGIRSMEASLNASQLEILGAVLLANGKIADAIRVLERGDQQPKANAGLRVTLARAYHLNNQPTDRDLAIQRAENTPSRSPREHAELIAAKKFFEWGNP